MKTNKSIESIVDFLELKGSLSSKAIKGKSMEDIQLLEEEAVKETRINNYLAKKARSLHSKSNLCLVKKLAGSVSIPKFQEGIDVDEAISK